MVLGAVVLSCLVVSNSVNPGTVTCQAPLATEFSRQEYWSGFPFPTPGDLPDPGIKVPSPTSSALAERFFITEPLGKTLYVAVYICIYRHRHGHTHRYS